MSTLPISFDVDETAHAIAEKVARDRVLKYYWPRAPCNPPNTPIARCWLVDRNTPTMARYYNYLEARGLLERHPDNPKWLRLVWPTKA